MSHLDAVVVLNLSGFENALFENILLESYIEFNSASVHPGM